MSEAADGDALLEALDGLVAALERTNEEVAAALDRVRQLRTARVAGRSSTELVAERHGPLALGVTAGAEGILEAARSLRRAEAETLRAEGQTMEALARHFGVTRQRVAAYLRAPDEPR